jgi:dihydroneopterin aldolase
MTTRELVSCIHLHDLEFNLHLGWTDAERATPQRIIVDIKLQFSTPPLASATDNLNDTVCYDALLTQIKTHLAGKSIRLLEHLAEEIYQAIKTFITTPLSTVVRVTKKIPIVGVIGNVTFEYGDKSLC